MELKNEDFDLLLKLGMIYQYDHDDFYHVKSHLYMGYPKTKTKHIIPLLKFLIKFEKNLVRKETRNQPNFTKKVSTNKGKMTSIETEYNGYKFRSRLEAKWAMFFDAMNIKYEYEPEGFECGDKRYLPDFYLPDVYLRRKVGVYIEIKPANFKKPDGYLQWFSEPIVLFCGMPHEFIWSNSYPENENSYEIMKDGFDSPMLILKCKNCNTVYIQYPDSNYEVCPKCDKRDVDIDFLNHCADKAKQARFEFLNESH